MSADVTATSTRTTPVDTNTDADAAWSVFLGHWALLALLQLESYFLFLYPGGFEPMAAGLFLVKWPFIQFENLMGAAILVLIYGLIGWNRVGRLLFLALYAVVGFYLVADQVAFGIFGDHFRFSFTEGRSKLQSAVGSFFAEAGPWFWANLLIWLGLNVWLYRRLPYHSDSDEGGGGSTGFTTTPAAGHPHWRRLLVPGLLVVYFIASGVIARAHSFANLERHPLLTLVADITERSGPPPGFSRTDGGRRAGTASDSERIADINTLRYGSFSEPASVSRQVAAAATALRRHGQRPPNIFLIILESTGARQLLVDGRPSPVYAPLLNKLSDHAVVLDTVYSTFPGTVRAHLSMITGGLTITWGSVYDELISKFTQPTLTSELRRLGYKTGVFAAGDLEFENMHILYQDLGYDEYFHPGLASEAWKKEHKINSWGCSEDAVASVALQWLDRMQGATEPILLEYLPHSSHHPYSWIDGYPVPFPGKDNLEKYYNSIAFTDKTIEILLDGLDQRGFGDDLLIVVCGDHAESFGKYHKQNLIHKNFLYEDNVHTFFMVADRKRLRQHVKSHRIGSGGDFLPTLLNLLTPTVPRLRGQDLLGSYTPRIAYFHKNAHPELWGCRDGQYKYIARKCGEKLSELYDLSVDPNEQHNLAASFADRLPLYDRLCAEWYISVNDAYVNGLPEFNIASGIRSLRPADVTDYGPKILAIGVSDSSGDFRELGAISPNQHLTAWTQWVAYNKDTTIRYEWVGPTGRRELMNFLVKADWSRTRVTFPGKLPLEPGEWKLTLYDGKHALLDKSFTVTASAPVVEKP